jgi:hypothetical protein
MPADVTVMELATASRGELEVCPSRAAGIWETITLFLIENPRYWEGFMKIVETGRKHAEIEV